MIPNKRYITGTVLTPLLMYSHEHAAQSNE
jgi:hypothetical protein